jgi:cell division protein FtsB
MINFNLLPPEAREELRWEKINRSFVAHSIIIVAMVFIFILFLLIIQLYADIKLSDLEKTINLRKENVRIQEVKDLENEIENFNRHLTTIDKIQKNHLYFSQVISIFTKNVPSSVQIARLNIIQPKEEKKNNTVQAKKTSVTGVSSQETEEKKFQININGKAAKRNDLLFFKNALEKTSCFAKIYSPLSNLVEREDIDFSFVGDLNKEFLFKK